MNKVYNLCSSKCGLCCNRVFLCDNCVKDTLKSNGIKVNDINIQRISDKKHTNSHSFDPFGCSELANELIKILKGEK